MNPATLRSRLESALWCNRGERTKPWRRIGLQVARALFILARDTAGGELTLRAMGLVYTTLLSLVPLLALSFSVLKAFGVHNQIRPFLQGILQPLGESRDELINRIIDFINNMDVGILGSMGLALLVYTAVSLVQKVEEAFNYIWLVAQPRSFGERFSRYLTLLLFGPILVFAALGITASISSTKLVREILSFDPLGGLFVDLGRFMPYVLVIAAFTVAYYFIPNTAVSIKSAVLGGVVAGIAWQTAGWAFAEFTASSQQYRAIYSSFAIIVLFMIWLYLSWRILLFGAGVAFYHQHPEYLRADCSAPGFSNRLREQAAFAIMALIAGRFRAGSTPLSGEAVAREMGLPVNAVAQILATLREHGLLTVAGENREVYLPSRELTRISLWEVFQAIRAGREEASLDQDSLTMPPEIGAIVHRIDMACQEALADLDVGDIAGEKERGPSESSPGPDA